MCYSFNIIVKFIFLVCEDLKIDNNHFGDFKQFIEGLILKNEFDLLQSWIGSQKISLKLLYNGKINGFSSQIFHQRCDHQGPTLTLIKSHLERRFGGFTYENWNGHGNYKNDQRAFLFSLNHRQKFESQNYDHIICNPNYGPTFGIGHDLYIANEAATNFNSYSRLGSSYSYSQGNLNPDNILAGSNYFLVTGLEVYQVEFV